MATLTQSVS